MVEGASGKLSATTGPVQRAARSDDGMRYRRGHCRRAGRFRQQKGLSL